MDFVKVQRSIQRYVVEKAQTAVHGVDRPGGELALKFEVVQIVLDTRDVQFSGWFAVVALE